MFDVRQIAGARGSARIPVSRAVLNQLAAKSLAGRSVPVRELDIRPHAGDRFDVAITLNWPLAPVLTVSFVVDRQPAFPASPVLVLRWSFLGALGDLASKFVGTVKDRLPRGVRLEGEQVLLDIPALAAGTDAELLMGYVTALELHTLEDRAVIDAELAVPE